MCGLYVLYVFATFYTSRSDEPLHADVALHEFPPQDGGIGEDTRCLMAGLVLVLLPSRRTTLMQQYACVCSQPLLSAAPLTPWRPMCACLSSVLCCCRCS